jgi:hypothetical protein
MLIFKRKGTCFFWAVLYMGFHSKKGQSEKHSP